MTKELELRPSCHACGEFFEIRSGRTAEQDFCGTWYDHPATRFCGNSKGSVLYPSEALRAQLAASGRVVGVAA